MGKTVIKESKQRIQAGMAIASFSVGSIISFICLFFVEPIGEIQHSAIAVVSEFLILAGALLGIDIAVDSKLEAIETKFAHRLQDKDKESEQ